ncbi:MAG: GerW family sporulation protein [Oscillospiraceae bacterium]
MSHPLFGMIDSTLQRIRDIVDVNSVVGDPITTPEGVTILPICKISYGFGGGGSDFPAKAASRQEYPFGGGTGLGVRMTPIAFLVIKGESVRMLPIAAPVSCTADRVVEQLPDLVDKLCAMFHHEGKEEDGQG